MVQALVAGEDQAGVIPETPLVADAGLVEEVAGVVKEDVECDGHVFEEGVVGRISVVFLGHGHKDWNLI